VITFGDFAVKLKRDDKCSSAINGMYKKTN
jgi:hypothetical protein